MTIDQYTVGHGACGVYATAQRFSLLRASFIITGLKGEAILPSCKAIQL